MLRNLQSHVQAFTRRYGSGYVSETVSGCWFHALMRAECQSTEARSSMETQLRACISGHGLAEGQAEGALAIADEASRLSILLQIECDSGGATEGWHPPTELRELRQMYRDYDAQLRPMTVLVQPYAGTDEYEEAARKFAEQQQSAAQRLPTTGQRKLAAGMLNIADQHMAVLSSRLRKFSRLPQVAELSTSVNQHQVKAASCLHCISSSALPHDIATHATRCPSPPCWSWEQACQS